MGQWGGCACQGIIADMAGWEGGGQLPLHKVSLKFSVAQPPSLLACTSHRAHILLLRPACPRLQLEEVEEVAGLDEEADLPLEELLARYGNYHLQAAAGGGGAEDEEMPGGWGWAGLPFLLFLHCLFLAWRSVPVCGLQRAGAGMTGMMPMDAHALAPCPCICSAAPFAPADAPAGAAAAPAAAVKAVEEEAEGEPEIKGACLEACWLLRPAAPDVPGLLHASCHCCAACLVHFCQLNLPASFSFPSHICLCLPCR